MNPQEDFTDLKRTLQKYRDENERLREAEAIRWVQIILKQIEEAAKEGTQTCCFSPHRYKTITSCWGFCKHTRYTGTIPYKVMQKIRHELSSAGFQVVRYLDDNSIQIRW